MMHDGLWQQLVISDGQEVSKRAQCLYNSDHDRYIVTLLYTEYTVDVEQRKIFSNDPDSGCAQAGFLEQLCILTYLINCKDLSLSHKLVKPESLPTGAFFFRGPHALPINELEKSFGNCPKLLSQIGQRIGAGLCDFGDASIELCALPRVPITIVIWGGDEDFPARASILFDQTVSQQLPLDALGSLVNIAVKSLIDEL